jgi:hypothetical protein
MSYNDLTWLRNNISIAIGRALLAVEGKIAAASTKPKNAEEFAEITLKIHQAVMQECKPDLLKASLILYDKQFKELVAKGWNVERTKDGTF